MSQSTPPRTDGQIDSPNPLELIWEKNKKLVLGLLVLIMVSIAGSYAWAYVKQKKVDKEWANFHESTNLVRGLERTVKQEDIPASFRDDERFKWQFMSHLLGVKQQELVTKLTEELEGADESLIQAQLKAAKGKKSEPWLLWVLANRSFALQEYEQASAHLQALENGFKGHFLCAVTDYPPQIRQEVPEEETEEEAKETAKKEEEEAKLLAAERGSPVSTLQAAIRKNRDFTEKHPHLFKVQEAKGPEVFVMNTSFGQIKLRLYSDQAPQHAAAFKELVSKGFYDGMRIHKITKAPSDKSNPGAATTLRWGLEASKDDDRSKWLEADVDQTEEESLKPLDFEENNLSFFPGMLAAENAASTAEEDKGQDFPLQSVHQRQRLCQPV